MNYNGFLLLATPVNSVFKSYLRNKHKLKEKMGKSLSRWIAKRYGSRQGFILTHMYRLIGLIGGYQKYKQIDWSQVKRLVFICKGNICRSAFAEEVAKTLNMEAISCGIDTHDDRPANDRAIIAAANKGFDLSKHKTRKITSIDIKKSDLLIVMEPYQIKYLEMIMGDQYLYTMIGLWGMPAIPYIHDPYGASNEYFERCFEHIEISVRTISENCNKSIRQENKFIHPE